MRCCVYDCRNNEDGYCTGPEFVVIDEYGRCIECWPPIREGEPDE